MIFYELLRHWKTVLIATVITSLAGSLWFQTNRLDAAKTELAEIQRVSNEATQQTEANLDHIRTQIPVMVAQAESNAVRNYISRYGTRRVNHADRPATERVRSQDGDSQAASPARVDAACPDAMAPDADFIKQCAATTALFNAWRKLCEVNPLTCEIK
jgi:hypothetical protein